jgi:methylated-DNA-[protein]-cysteine S-methyltransferase
MAENGEQCVRLRLGFNDDRECKTKPIMKQRSSIQKTQATKFYSIMNSGIGHLMLVANDSALTGVYFVGRDHTPTVSKQGTMSPRHPILLQAAKQLQEYMAGKRTRFSLPLRTTGTAFQRKVWEQIALIPYGRTLSYAELAERAGAPRAIRAAGASTGRNPLSIIIPCHRVVGKNGALRGFAGGVERKSSLLKLENPDAEMRSFS